MKGLFRRFTKKHPNTDIKERYKELGLAIPDKPVGIRQYMQFLIDVTGQSHIPSGLRIFPLSFNPYDKTVVGFLRSGTWKWESVRAHLEASGALGVLVRIPLFWQVEPLVFYACRDAGSFLFLNDIANMPVGRAAIQNANMNTIISTPDDAREFSNHLQDHGCSNVLNWIVIHSIEEVLAGIEDISYTNASYVAHEVHIFPGVPLLVQCAHISKHGARYFHLCDEFYLDIQSGSVYITGSSIDFLPLLNVEVNISIKESKEKCNCGKKILSL